MFLWQFFLDLLSALFAKPVYKDEIPLNMPPTPPKLTVAQSSPDTLGSDWSNTTVAHHNVRALCDLEGLTYEQKETLTACVWVESEFKIHAVRHNYAFHADGTRYLASTDNGICQWNTFWHGKEITPDQALNNPEMAVRLMCQYWKAGRMNQWVSYSTGAYKPFLGNV